MKRIISFLLALTLIISTFAVTVSAEQLGNITAKYGAPVIDGYINDDEYGPVFTQDSSNNQQITSVAPSIDYRFAWTEEGLYFGFSSGDILNEDGTTSGNLMQLLVNPDNAIPRDHLALAFQIWPAEEGPSTIWRNFYKKPSEEYPDEDVDFNSWFFDISDVCRSESRIEDGIVYMEMFIPVSEFRVASDEQRDTGGHFRAEMDASNLQFSAGYDMGIGFNYLHPDGVWYSPNNIVWALYVNGFGTLNFEGPTVAAAEPETSAPAQTDAGSINPNTGENGFALSFSIIVLTLAIIWASATFIRKSKNRA